MVRWPNSRSAVRLASIAVLVAIAGCTTTEVASAPTERDEQPSESSSATTTTSSVPETTAARPERPQATTTTQSTTTSTTQPATTTTWPSNNEPISAAPQVAAGADYAQRLLDLGFWHDYGSDTLSHAVMAARKYYGLPLSGSVDQQLLDTLAAQTVQAHGTADAGDFVEIDKSLQLLFVVRGGKTMWVFNVSTGSEVPYEESGQYEAEGETLTGDAVTHPGFYSVWKEVDGKREGELGGLWRPKYFDNGIAVHGSSSGLENGPWSVPMSHGCTRMTDAAMNFIWEENLIPLRSAVWVHGDIPS